MVMIAKMIVIRLIIKSLKIAKIIVVTTMTKPIANMNFDAKVWVCFQMTSDFVESLFLNGENDLYGKFLSFNPPSIIQAESGKK